MTHRPGHHVIRSIKVPGFAGTSISLLRLDQEKRRHYRVSQAKLPTLQVEVPYSDGSKRHGTCRDISVGGASVTFTSEQDPGLEVGDEIILLFQTESQPRTISLAARIVSRRWMDAEGIGYAFSFTRPDELRAQVWGAWGRWFNRRRFQRFVSEKSQGVVVQMGWKRGMLDGRLIDVSLGGLSVMVRREEAALLTNARIINLAFGLGEGEGGLRFRGIVRSCSAGPRDARIGIELMRDESYERSGPQLQRWIERRMHNPNGA